MKFATALLGLAMAAAAQDSFAQESADLSITGTIFPGSCTFELGNGGVADLGSINTAQLSADAYTDLTPVDLTATIACESAVRYALRGTDNTTDTSAYAGRYGLGLTPDNEKIGGAQIELVDVLADGVPGYGTQSDDGGQSWTVAQNGGINNVIGMADLRGYAKESGVTAGPAPTEMMVGTLRISARIQPVNELTISDDVPIDGKVSLDLIYL